MKRHLQSVARLLLAVVLLAQLGSAYAAVQSWEPDAGCSLHGVVLGHVESGALAGMAGDDGGCDDAGCVSHCVAPVPSSGAPIYAIATHVATSLLAVDVPLIPPDPLDRPPKLFLR